MYYIKISSSSPFEIAPEVKSIVHALAAQSPAIYSSLCLSDFAVFLIHTDFVQLLLKMRKTQSITTHMGANRYTGRSQKHNYNEHHQKSDQEMHSCGSGFTIWVNREIGRSHGARQMVTLEEAKVDF